MELYTVTSTSNELYTVTSTSNDHATHDADADADDDGFDRDSGSGTCSNRNQEEIQHEYESSQEDIISLNNSILSEIFSSSSSSAAAVEKHPDHDNILSSSSHSMPSLPSSSFASGMRMRTPLNNNNREGGKLSDIFSAVEKDIFSSSSAIEKRHQQHDLSSPHSMPSLSSSSFASGMRTPLNNNNNREGGKLSDIFSSSSSAVEKRHQHDLSSRSMSSLPSFAVTPPNEHPYNYVKRNNSHDDIDDGVIVDRRGSTRTCNSSIQNKDVPSQEDIVSFNNFSNIFSSSDAALNLARDELQQDLARLDESRWQERHLLSSTSSSRSLLSMPSLPSSSSTMASTKKGKVGKLPRRSRSLVSSSWNDRFQELIQFREVHDHCFVPRIYHENPRLSQWVRKQRHQRKRKVRGLHSTLSDERQELLVVAGFCWDSHQALWKERFQSLEVFHFDHGHCVVPSNHPDSSLFNWVRYQRKQFKLYQEGSKSSMDEERILHLISIGFK